jgi:hypothetical protein
MRQPVMWVSSSRLTVGLRASYGASKLSARWWVAESGLAKKAKIADMRRALPLKMRKTVDQSSLHRGGKR